MFTFLDLKGAIMRTQHTYDELATLAPPEGTPEHDEYLTTINRIACLQVFRDANVRGVEFVQAQIAGFHDDSSYHALVAMAEQLGSRSRVVAQQDNDLRELYRKLDDLRDVASYRVRQAPPEGRCLYDEEFPNDRGRSRN